MSDFYTAPAFDHIRDRTPGTCYGCVRRSFRSCRARRERGRSSTSPEIPKER